MKFTRNATMIEVESIPNGLYILDVKDQKTGQRIQERIVIAR